MRRNLIICSCLALITLAAYWQAWGPPLYHAGLVGEAAADGSQPAKPQYRNFLCHSFNAVVDALHLPTHELEYVYFDDPGYVTANLHVKQGLTWESVQWAFTTLDQSNWHPLTWLSHMLDIEMFGFKRVDQPSHVGPHMVNVVLHTSSAILLFLLLQWMTGAAWRSAMVAALFAVHPMHVESVAWVAERKDVLSTLLGLLTLAAYVWYVQRLKETRGLPLAERLLLGAAWYLPIMVLFALCLLAKPMLVTLPCLLLLLDYWPLGRLDVQPGQPRPPQTPPRKTLEMSRAARARLKDKPVRPRPQWEEAAQSWFRQAFLLVVEKLPLAALVAASCVATYYAQNKGGSVARPGLPVVWRPRQQHPDGLRPVYRRHVLAVPSGGFLSLRHRPGPMVCGGLGSPVVAIDRGGHRGRLFRAALRDRGMAVVFGHYDAGDRPVRSSRRPVHGRPLFVFHLHRLVHHRGLGGIRSAGAMGLGPGGLGRLCRRRAGRLRGNYDHTGHCMARHRNGFPLHPCAVSGEPRLREQLGRPQLGAGRRKAGAQAQNPAEAQKKYRQEAIRHWRKAVDIRRGFSDAWNNLGCAYRHRDPDVNDATYLRQLEEAVRCFENAIRYKEIHSNAHSNLALTLWELKRPEEALREFRNALALRQTIPMRMSIWPWFCGNRREICSRREEGGGSRLPGRSGPAPGVRYPLGSAQPPRLYAAWLCPGGSGQAG